MCIGDKVWSSKCKEPFNVSNFTYGKELLDSYTLEQFTTTIQEARCFFAKEARNKELILKSRYSRFNSNYYEWTVDPIETIQNVLQNLAESSFLTAPFRNRTYTEITQARELLTWIKDNKTKLTADSEQIYCETRILFHAKVIDMLIEINHAKRNRVSGEPLNDSEMGSLYNRLLYAINLIHQYSSNEKAIYSRVSFNPDSSEEPRSNTLLQR